MLVDNFSEYIFKIFCLGNNKMVFLGTIGKGSYGRVVKAQLDDKTVMEKALKIQKPACSWEWYICKEIKHRLQDPKKVSTYLIFSIFVVFVYIRSTFYDLLKSY